MKGCVRYDSLLLAVLLLLLVMVLVLLFCCFLGEALAAIALVYDSIPTAV